MKINEVTQPSAKAIFESLSMDTEHSFSQETLMEISENVASAKFSGNPMSLEEVKGWLDSL